MREFIYTLLAGALLASCAEYEEPLNEAEAVRSEQAQLAGIGVNCVAVGSLKELPAEGDVDARFEVSGNVKLCKGAVYTNRFEIVASGVTLDCDYATLDTREKADKRYVVRSIGHGNTQVRNCNIRGPGIQIRSEYDPVDDVANNVIEGNTIDGLIEPRSPYDPNPRPPIEGSVRIDGRGTNTGVGVFLRTTNTRILNNTIKNCESGVYLEWGSHHNELHGNIFIDNGEVHAQLSVDSSYSNVISDNTFKSTVAGMSRGGIDLYRNCGEHGSRLRPNESSSNSIFGNTFLGFRNPNFKPSAKNTLGMWPGRGINVASRQANPLVNSQNWYANYDVPNYSASLIGEVKPVDSNPRDKIGRCNDDSYQRYDWKTGQPISDPGGRMSVNNSHDYALYRADNSLDHDSAHFTAQRHWDFAPNNNIYGNHFYNNDIGIEVGDQETRVVGNDFHSSTYADVVIGNWIVDQVNRKREAKGYATFDRYLRAFHTNAFLSEGTYAPTPCITTSAGARSRIAGSDLTECSKEAFSDLGFARNYEAELAGQGDQLQRHSNIGRTYDMTETRKSYGADPSLDGAGHLVYGPYVTDIPAGNRTATFILFRAYLPAGVPSTDALVGLDVYDAQSGTVLEKRELTGASWTTARRFQEFDLDFQLDTVPRTLEFRVNWYKKALIKVDAIRVH